MNYILTNTEVTRSKAMVFAKENNVFIVGGFCERTCGVYDSTSKKIVQN